MRGNQRKLGVRPETHEAFGKVADATGWTVSLAVDLALEQLIKAKRLKVPYAARPKRSARKSAAA